MKVKKIPMRSCVITHEKCEKRELLRIVKDKDGIVSVDLTGKMNGRGAYIKKDLEVLEKAKKTKALEKHLETSIPDSIYESIEKIIKEN
ncbi:MAG: YlxR family protein [Erysipelotrichaceae bacterium]|nr:YlxR family protein [Erysipelotrichaceae bacterium]